VSSGSRVRSRRSRVSVEVIYTYLYARYTRWRRAPRRTHNGIRARLGCCSVAGEEEERKRKGKRKEKKRRKQRGD
jgi:hypothetical protein